MRCVLGAVRGYKCVSKVLRCVSGVVRDYKCSFEVVKCVLWGGEGNIRVFWGL